MSGLDLDGLALDLDNCLAYLLTNLVLYISTKKTLEIARNCLHRQSCVLILFLYTESWWWSCSKISGFDFGIVLDHDHGLIYFRFY